MSVQKRVELAVCGWSAWAPGVINLQAWHEWANGRREIGGPVKPDVQFVKPMMRRRLSGLSRMAFRVASDCLAETDAAPAYVFCSRYGEYNRTYDILNDVLAEEPASAMAFSMSVHNTAASLFSIDRQDTAMSTSLAGGEATLETAFLESWSLLTSGEAPTVLLVYHDEPLPDLYRKQMTTVTKPIAIALMLRTPDVDAAKIRLVLEWKKRDQDDLESESSLDSTLQVLKLLLCDENSVTVNTDRLVWNWSREAA